MKKHWLISLALCLPGITGSASSDSLKSVTANAADSGLSFRLEADLTTLRLGQDEQLKLILVGQGVDQIIAGTEGLNYPETGPGSFTRTLEFKPQREGSFTFGPYTVTINGQKLTSNTLHIEVLPRWDGTFGTFFRVDKSQIGLGESFQLVIETWKKEQDHTPFPGLRRDAGFARSLGTSRYGGSASSSYERVVWIITPRKPGAFKINSALFEKFPADVDPPDLTVEVTPAAAPPAPPASP